MIRCPWCLGDPIYIKYHDEEWGVPVYDDGKIFEFLVLEGAQAGLSWLTVLKKRDNYRRLYEGFDAGRVAAFDQRKVETMLADAGIIRNRRKIESSINNARLFLKVQREFGTFSEYIWRFVSGKPRLNSWKEFRELPVKTNESVALSKDLIHRGFKFVGATIMYAHMQAAGMVNDHLVSCFRYRQLNTFFPQSIKQTD